MKEVETKRKKELKYSRNSDFWAAGFMFTFGCAPTLVRCKSRFFRFSFFKTQTSKGKQR